MPALGLCPAELQWEVLSDEMVSVKQHNNVNLKFCEEKREGL
jgi:hypothetical protein